MPRKPIPVAAGTKFGRWTVVNGVPVHKSGRVAFLVRCVCGLEEFVLSTELRNGHTRKCSQCRYRDRARRMGAVRRDGMDAIERRLLRLEGEELL